MRLYPSLSLAPRGAVIWAHFGQPCTWAPNHPGGTIFFLKKKSLVYRLEWVSTMQNVFCVKSCFHYVNSHFFPCLKDDTLLLAQSCSWRTLRQGPHGCRRSGRRSHCHTWSIRKRGPCTLGAEKFKKNEGEDTDGWMPMHRICLGNVFSNLSIFPIFKAALAMLWVHIHSPQIPAVRNLLGSCIPLPNVKRTQGVTSTKKDLFFFYLSFTILFL